MEKRHFKILVIFLSVFFIAQMSIYLFNLSCDLKFKQEVSIQQPISYSVFIDLEERILYLLRNGECFKTYSISVGKVDTPSPIGYWKIVSKSDWGEGFGGRWMGLNVTWGKYHVEHIAMQGKYIIRNFLVIQGLKLIGNANVITFKNIDFFYKFF